MPRRWWQPSPLVVWFLAIAGFDAIILWFASGVVSSGNDAAGNGMANAFREVFVEAGAYLLGFLTLLFLAIRHRGIRITLMGLLLPLTLFFLMLLR
jgi:hypothetical protein